MFIDLPHESESTLSICIIQEKTMGEEADFHSSELGTKQYWDDAYSRELKAFEDIGDVGEIWFGEEAQDRIVRWLTEKSELSPLSHTVDLGCGNGMLLLALREEGFTDLMGVDYSEGAIQLSRNVAQKAGVTDIKFEVCDILSAASTTDLIKIQPFDICLDKGTYDAISLRDTSDPSDRRAYSLNVSTLLKEGGFLILASCNWTREQLEQHFQNEFELFHEIPAPKFNFGGKTGQTVTTIVLKKRNKDS